LFTAEGLLRALHHAVLRGIGGATRQIIYESYLRWLHTQGEVMDKGEENRSMRMKETGNGWLIRQKALFRRRSPGGTCLSALESGIAGTIENPINDSKGCGGIMRVAPVGLVFPGQNEYSFRTACELAALTHGHPSGYLSAGFFASVISDLAIGMELGSSIMNAMEILEKWEGCNETRVSVENALSLYYKAHRELQSAPAGIPRRIEELGRGWVGEEALAISLFCSLLYRNDFEKGVLAAINHSGDSDSTGSITGNILGLVNGLNAIPQKWIMNLRSNEIVREVGEDLHTSVKGNEMNPDDGWWDKYPGE
jgi:ADP-ribosylglycohydrolase